MHHAAPSDQIVALQNNAHLRWSTALQTWYALHHDYYLCLVRSTVNDFLQEWSCHGTDGLFKYLSKLTPKTQTTNAILTVSHDGYFSSFVHLWHRLSDIAIFTIWIFYTAAFLVSLFTSQKLDKDVDPATLFKTPLFPGHHWYYWRFVCDWVNP